MQYNGMEDLIIGLQFPQYGHFSQYSERPLHKVRLSFEAIRLESCGEWTGSCTSGRTGAATLSVVLIVLSAGCIGRH